MNFNARSEIKIGFFTLSIVAVGAVLVSFAASLVGIKILPSVTAMVLTGLFCVQSFVVFTRLRANRVGLDFLRGRKVLVSEAVGALVVLWLLLFAGQNAYVTSTGILVAFLIMNFTTAKFMISAIQIEKYPTN